MAAEVVETTRVYARTCARLDPLWALEIGAHLLTVSHSDPYWNAESGRVLVRRKSRLYGLEVESRSVSFGSIDSVRATEIFIREGLVNDTVTWPFAFIPHNRRMRDELEAVLTRLRSVGYMGVDEAVYRFYAERIVGVSAVPELVRLVRDRQAGEPRFLMMAAGDLGIPEDAPVDGQFPAALPMENRALPLQYAYRPGQEDDGVTLTVNVRELPGLTPSDVDWAVPGHLGEKVEHYLRALPKEQRRLFVPMAERAQELAAALAAARGSRARGETVAEALAARIREDYRVTIDPAAWEAKPIPERLRVRIRVVDDEGAEVAADRDLSDLLARIAERERSGAVTLQRQDPEEWARARARFERGPQSSWEFGTVPDRVVILEKAGFSTYGYPGLAAEENGVALRLFRTPEEAKSAGEAGLAAMFGMLLKNDLAWLHRDLRAISGIGPSLAMIKSSGDVREDAYLCIRDWILRRSVAPLSAPAFTAAVAQAREDLRGLVPRFVELVGTISKLRQDLLVEKQPYPGMPGDIERLVPPDFLRRIPYTHLRHLPRYLRAMALRNSRRRENPARDDERARKLDPFIGAADRMTGDFKWLLEEFRVSLFAQELGTAMPVSAVKLEKAMAAPPDGTDVAPGTSIPPAPATPPARDRSAKLKSLRSLDGLFPR